MKRSSLVFWPIIGLAIASAHAESQSVAELVQGTEFRYTKGNIDIQTLSTVIADRQKAISKDVLHRYLLRDQAGSLSQNLLAERLIDQLLNSHTPKEITQGLYTYTMESFTLGMMSLALGRSKSFELPQACAAESNLPMGQGRLLSKPCHHSLRTSDLAPLARIDSLMESVEWKNGSEHFRALMKAYPKDSLTLAKIRGHYLKDLAYLVVVDSHALFGRTLFKRGAHLQSYFDGNFQVLIRKRWNIDADQIKKAYTQLKIQLFDVADVQGKAIQEQLRVSNLLQYAAENSNGNFQVYQNRNKINELLREGGVQVSPECRSALNEEIQDPAIKLFGSLKNCKSSIEGALINYRDTIKRLGRFSEKRDFLEQSLLTWHSCVSVMRHT